MFRNLKKLFKNTIVNNNRGSALSVSLIVITILTFTIANITSISVNLAASTNVSSETIVDENTAKGLIRITIDEFQNYLAVDTNTYISYLNDEREINGCIAKYDVCVDDRTAEFAVEGQADSSRVFRFSYNMGDGTEIVKYLYFSTGGTVIGGGPTGGADFANTILSNEDVLLSGGLYTDINVFANDVRVSNSASYYNTYNTAFEAINTSSLFFPNFSEGDSTIHHSGVYEYCDSQAEVCYTYGGYNSYPYEVIETNFSTFELTSDIYEKSAELKTGVSNSDLEPSDDLFNGFDFDQYIIDLVLLAGEDAATDLLMDFYYSVDPVDTLDELKNTIELNLNSEADRITYTTTLMWDFAPGTGTGTDPATYADDEENQLIEILMNIVSEYITYEEMEDLGWPVSLIGTDLLYEDYFSQLNDIRKDLHDLMTHTRNYIATFTDADDAFTEALTVLRNDLQSVFIHDIDSFDDFLLIDWYDEVTYTYIPDAPYVTIPTDSNAFGSSMGHYLEYNGLWYGDLTIEYNLEIAPDRILVVFGDLYINNQVNATLLLQGNIYTTGNVYFLGNNVQIEGTIMAGSYLEDGTPVGGTKIDFNEGKGIYTKVVSDPNTVIDSKGFTLFSKNSVFLNSMFESHNVANVPSTDVLRAFIYTDESIVIDAVNSQVNLQGALFARALGNEVPKPSEDIWYLLPRNDSSETIRGIIINSFRGYVSDVGNEYLQNSSSNWNRFKFSELPGTLDENFNIPGFEFLITVSPIGGGEYLFETTEFKYE